MFARVTTFQEAPDRIEDSIRIFREQAAPAVQGQPGFQGAYVLVDRQTGKGLTLCVWESEAAMTSSDAAVRQVREQGIQAAGVRSIPTAAHYKVAVQAQATGQAAATGTRQAVARVTAAQVPPERIEELLRHIRAQNAPTMQQQVGFQRAYYCIDRQSGQAIAVSFWQSRAAVQQAEATLNQARDQAGQVSGIQGAPTTAVYEVAVQVQPAVRA